MAEQSLVEYIKTNHHAGFAEEEIREQLQKAGWDEWNIEEAFAEARGGSAMIVAPRFQSVESFFSKNLKTITIVVAVLVALPLVGYGAYALFHKSSPAQPTSQNAGISPVAQNPVPTSTQPNTGSVPQVPNQVTDQLAASRDLARLSDIQKLQSALGIYFQKNKAYPKTLNDLVNQTVLVNVPTDPKTNEAYLYNALGTPPLYYSIAFLLETDVGTLKSGLQVVTSETPLQSDTIRKQQELVKGATKILSTLQITDLSKLPFYPKEEVTVEITPPQGVVLASSRLIVDNLDLIAKIQPYEFRFTAPAKVGQYQVEVFGFDLSGNGYAASTILSVAVPQ